jgi:uncharacterized protein
MPLLSVLLSLVFQLQLPAPTGYVNDFAHIIDPASQAQMEALIDQVRTGSRGEIVVVTLSDLGGREAIDVARDIGRQWKVGAQGAAGDQRRNTGVVLLLVPGARPGDGRARLAIATGTGAEGFVTDAMAGRIRDEVGRRSVSAGSYAAGLVVGVQLLAGAYAREFGFNLTGGAAPPPPEPAEEPVHGRGGGAIGAVVLLTLFLVFASIGRRRGAGGLLQGLIIGSILGGGGRRGGWGGGGFGGGGFGGFGGGGGFGGFGGGGGFSGGGASGGF